VVNRKLNSWVRGLLRYVSYLNKSMYFVTNLLF